MVKLTHINAGIITKLIFMDDNIYITKVNKYL